MVDKKDVKNVLGVVILCVVMFFASLFVSNLIERSMSSKVENNAGNVYKLSDSYFKVFHLNMEIYDVDVVVLIASDRYEALKYARKYFEDTTLRISDFDAKAVTFFNGQDAPLMWLPKVPENPEEVGTLNHELFHATSMIMQHVGIPLTNSSNEAYAYVMGSLSKQFHMRVRK